MHNILRALESVFHISMLLLLMGAFLPLWRKITVGKVDPAEGDPVLQVVLLVGYLVGLLLLLPYARGIPGLVLRTPLVWLLVGWAFFSIIWSEVPEVTFRKAIAVLLTTLYALVLAIRHSFSQWLPLLALAFAIAFVGSLATTLLIPEWSIVPEPRGEPWRGWFVQKNLLGRTALVGVLAFAVCLTFAKRRGPQLLWVMGILLGLFLLYKSDSKASWLMFGVVAVGGLFFWLAWQLQRVWPLYLLGALFLAGSVGVALLQNAEGIAQALGRDLTLTGRVPLWETVVGYIAKRPWLGYGFGAFWLPNAYGGEVSAIEGWAVLHAHNAYLDLWLDLGMLGLALGTLMLLRSFQTWHRAFMRTGSFEALFWLVMLVYLSIYNFAESAFLRTIAYDALPWVLLTTAYVAGERAVRINGHQLQSRGGGGL